MSTIYFLMFLLSLVAISTATTAGQTGEHWRQMPLVNRVHSRSSTWAKARNHHQLSEAVEKRSLWKAPEEYSGMHQAEKLMPTGLMSRKITMEKNMKEFKARENRVAGYSSGAGKDHVAKLNKHDQMMFVQGGYKRANMHTLEEASTKNKRPAGYRAKMTHINKKI
ncbi:hypothetical protein MIMGU_mgv1a015177mg [Erythranthe guttata]|uniref:Uncharacterized protein n=1 Tax=Erythranthe guttata TaxID=4155 RepID=A0A022PRE3_ERYGU|nr:hypothetical protein MIMGU_mgv1a015177mg [Erythranthe guttata]